MKRIFTSFFRTILPVQNFKPGIILFLLLCGSVSGHAQIVWNNASTNNLWYDAANWTPNTGPGAWTNSSIASFSNAGRRTIGLDLSQGDLSIARIAASSSNFLSPLDSVVIGNSSATDGTINLYGDNSGRIIDGSLSHLTFVDNIAGLPGKTTLHVAGANNTIRVYLDTIEIGVPVSGSSGLHVQCYGLSGNLILKGACTYTGTTSVENFGGGSSTHVYLAHPGGNTLNPLSDISLSYSGTMHVQTDQVIHDVNVNYQGWLSVENGATLTVTGTLYTYPGHITGKIKFAPGARLYYLGTGTTSSSEFPAVDGPSDVRLSWDAWITLHENREIPGSLSCENGALGIKLGNNNFTAASAACDNGCNFVITNGTGKLFLRSANNAPLNFPLRVNNFSDDPVTILNGQNLVYGVGVSEGINPALTTGNTAVNRTWTIQPSATPAAAVDVQFNYSNSAGNAGFNYSNPVDLLQYTTDWNVVQSNIAQTQPVNTSISTLTGGTTSLFAIQNTTAALAIAAIDINAVKQGSAGYINWKFNNGTANIKQVVLERSADGRNFTALLNTGVNQLFYTDNNLQAGRNYYRLKATGIYGKVNYSAVAMLLNNDGGFEIVSLMPNIVTTETRLNVTAVKKTKMDVVIMDAAGRPVATAVYGVAAGSNMFDMNVVRLAAGMYYLKVTTMEGDTKTVRFVKQ